MFQNIKNGRFYLGNCLEVMKEIPDGVIDMVLCDLPYGTTACKWDSIIPFEPLWKQYNRIIKEDGAVVLTGSQPFTSVLIMSNIDNFKYSWTWDKVNAIRNHLNAKKQPMRITEDIAVFYKTQCIYNPILRNGTYKTRKTTVGQSDTFGKVTGTDSGRLVNGLYPVNLIGIQGHNPNNYFHPTQKPVSLFEYLIKTYTNENDLVLDNCAGSGTTAIACENLNRKWVCIEKDEEYANKAVERIKNHQSTYVQPKACWHNYVENVCLNCGLSNG